MNNNQQQGGQNNQQPQNREKQRPVDQRTKNFDELLANHMNMVPKGVTYDVNQDDIQNAVGRCLQSLGVQNVGSKVFVVARYNPQFGQLLKGKEVNSKHRVDPFDVYVVVRLDKEDKRRAKGGKRNFGGNTGFSQVMGRLMHNKADKAQVQMVADKQLNEALTNFTTNEVKFHVMGGGNVARFRLDCDIVLRYVFDIPTDQGNFVLDFLNIRDYRKKGFRATVLKTVATKTFKQNDFDPGKYVY
mgnify:CR=1 FL=1|jgi:hypothetical protein